jgi:hypothetical protein
MKNLFLLPTDKPSRLYKNLLTDKLFILENSIMDVSECNREYQNINITSDNEDINENDYVITKDGRLFQVSYLLSKKIENASKVVLTTEKDLIKDGVQSIPDEFLEWFVKNPNCDEVRVVDVRYDISTLTNDVKKYPNLDVPDYKVIIPSEEPNIIDNWLEKNGNQEIAKQVEIEAEELSKQETLEKYIEREFQFNSSTAIQNQEYVYLMDKNRFKIAVNNILKYQQEQDKNKYSEEEVIKLLEKRDKYVGNWLPPIKWLEQNKNK